MAPLTFSCSTIFFQFVCVPHEGSFRLFFFWPEFGRGATSFALGFRVLKVVPILSVGHPFPRGDGWFCSSPSYELHPFPFFTCAALFFFSLFGGPLGPPCGRVAVLFWGLKLFRTPTSMFLTCLAPDRSFFPSLPAKTWALLRGSLLFTGPLSSARPGPPSCFVLYPLVKSVGVLFSFSRQSGLSSSPFLPFCYLAFFRGLTAHFFLFFQQKPTFSFLWGWGTCGCPICRPHLVFVLLPVVFGGFSSGPFGFFLPLTTLSFFWVGGFLVHTTVRSGLLHFRCPFGFFLFQ